MHREKSAKMAIWQKNSHFAILALFSLCIDFKNFFLPNDFLLIIIKDLLHNFSQKVYLALSRPVHVLIWEDKLNYFKFPLLDFKNSS